jgi:hypothetical protein
MNKVNRTPAMFPISTLEELIRHLADAGPDDLFVVRAQVLKQWNASVEIIPPAPLATPRRKWERSNWVLGHYPLGATKLNAMLASGEVVSKLVGASRWIYVPSLEAVGDPHARLKRGRPPKSTAAELVGSSSRGDSTYLAAQGQLLKQQQDAQPAREASRSTAASARAAEPRQAALHPLPPRQLVQARRRGRPRRNAHAAE